MLYIDKQTPYYLFFLCVVVNLQHASKDEYLKSDLTHFYCKDIFRDVKSSPHMYHNSKLSELLQQHKMPLSLASL